MKIKMPKLNKNAKKTLIRKAPEILTLMGTIGLMTAGAIGVSVTPKALSIIEEEKQKKNKELTKLEVVQATWKCYIPSVSIGMLSAICIYNGNRISIKRNAALAAACGISTQALSEYKATMKEVIGEKKAKEVEDTVAKEKIKNNPVKNNEIIITGKSNHLCYDSISGRYFKSDIETIKRTINELNRDMVAEMYISLNEFYSMIGLPSITIGDSIGWNIDDGFIDIVFSSIIAENGEPCLVISSDIAPRWDYRDLH